MKNFHLITLPLLAIFFISGCLYDAPPSKPASQLDTWLLGQWITQDKSGRFFEAIVTPIDNTHYHVSFCDRDQQTVHPWEFEAWISRVGNLQFLTLRSLSADLSYHDKYLFFHYELMTAEKNPENGVGLRRIRICEPQLDTSALRLDSYHLRQAITKKMEQGTLLLPSEAPLGFSVWTRVGGNITWPASKV